MSDIETQETQEPKKHAGGRPRRDALDAASLQEVFEASLKRGLVSTNATVQAQALKNAGDLLSPTLGELRAELSELKKKLATAEEALPVVTRERDQAQGIMVIAIQSALQGSAAKAELAKVLAEQNEWKAEQHQLLVVEARQCKWDADKSRRDAKELMESAQRQFSTTGLEALIDEMKRLVEVHNISMPDIWNLPKDVNPLLLELWGWPRIKSQLFVGYVKSYPEPTAEFRQLLFKYLRARLPIHGTMSNPIEHLESGWRSCRCCARDGRV